MASWNDIVEAEPDFAEQVARCFAIRKHATLATLRRDGSPRISGNEVEFDGGEIYLGMMPGSVKAQDVQRDPRLALHCPTEDPPDDDPAAWVGDAKIAGRALAVPTPSGAPEGHRFRIDIDEVVFTRVGDSRDHLLIQAWHPGRGLESHQRR